MAFIALTPQQPHATIEADRFREDLNERKSCLAPLTNCLFGHQSKTKSAAMTTLEAMGWSKFKTRKDKRDAYSSIARILPQILESKKRARVRISQRENPQAEQAAAVNAPQERTQSIFSRVSNLFTSPETLTAEQKAVIEAKEQRAEKREIVLQAMNSINTNSNLEKQNIAILDFSDGKNSFIDKTIGRAARITYNTVEYVSENKTQLALIAGVYLFVITSDTTFPDHNSLYLTGVKTIIYDLPSSIISFSATKVAMPLVNGSATLLMRVVSEACIPGGKFLGSLSYNITTNAIIPASRFLGSLGYNVTSNAIIPGIRVVGEKAIIPMMQMAGNATYNLLSNAVSRVTDGATQLALRAAVSGVSAIARSIIPVIDFSANATCALATNATL